MRLHFCITYLHLKGRRNYQILYQYNNTLDKNKNPSITGQITFLLSPQIKVNMSHNLCKPHWLQLCRYRSSGISFHLTKQITRPFRASLFLQDNDITVRIVDDTSIYLSTSSKSVKETWITGARNKR